MSTAEHETPREEVAKKKSAFDRVYIGPGSKGKLAKFFDTHEDVYKKILMFIEQGVYDYIAAEAMGITHLTWMSWLKRGEKEWASGKKTNYSRFFLDVRTAQSRGRLVAELEARRDDVKFWLTRGPGRTRPGRPGWTETITIAGDEELPLQIETSGDDSLSQQASIQDLAKTLLVMEELGLVQRTPLLGQSIIDASAHAIIDADTEDDFDEDENRSDKGYVPELTQQPTPPSSSSENPNGNGKK